MTNGSRKSTNADECYTPASYAELARNVLGAIDLDPSSCAVANATIRAVTYYTKDQDGLRAHWSGRVFMNCPYSNPAPWAAKLLEHYEARHVSAAVSLFNSRTGSRWFDPLARSAWRCEVFKRIRFYGPSTNGNGQTGMTDQVFFYLGPLGSRFAHVFSEVGRVLPPADTLRVTLSVTAACAACGRSLEHKRAGAVTCSKACKQRAHRKRQLESA